MSESDIVTSAGTGVVTTSAVVTDTPDTAAANLPKVPKKGIYVLEEGDTPGRVSIKLYGRSHRAVELARLNMDIAWEAGDVIELP